MRQHQETCTIKMVSSSKTGIRFFTTTTMAAAVVVDVEDVVVVEAVVMAKDNVYIAAHMD